jgi:hypothetical protein
MIKLKKTGFSNILDQQEISKVRKPERKLKIRKKE